MNKLSYTLTLLMISSFAIGNEVAEYNPSNAELSIPEVKIGTTKVYNARLKFDGSDNFKLLSYQDSSPNVPALTNPQEVEKWLAQGGYKSWSCQPAKHPQSGSSPHGDNRICSNPLLAASMSGSYPVGAASVKELYSGDKITGYALGVKIKAGEGKDTWHWYESFSGAVAANAIADSGCEFCHGKAPRDRVFVHVTQ